MIWNFGENQNLVRADVCLLYWAKMVSYVEKFVNGLESKIRKKIGMVGEKERNFVMFCKLKMCWKKGGWSPLAKILKDI